MSEQLAALRVRIGINSDGYADYPDFNTLACVIVSGMDWSKYVDVRGKGWLYDVTGHAEVSNDSPIGQQWGLLFVPEVFAIQAMAQFSAVCTRLTAIEAEEFYSKKIASNLPDEEIDEQVLAAISRKQSLGLSLTREQMRAIDPRDPTLGVRPNRKKKFSTFKKDRDFSVVDPT